MLSLAAAARAEVPIEPGATATIRLSPQGELAYPIAPRPPHAPANHGAILSVDIDEPGRYHVALDVPGRVDVIRDGKAVQPVGDRPGEAGSGAAAILDFDLPSGRYTIALSEMLAGTAGVTISR